jgi:hypothetical protein
MPSNYRDKNGKDPFSDELGRNPFADEGGNLPADSDDSPYAASVEEASYRPEFEAILPHRGRFRLRLAVIGLVSALLGLPIWFVRENPVGMFALAATLPAAVLAWKDLQAIQRGAMDPTGRATTRRAMLLGAVGTAVAMGIAVHWVLQIGQAVWDAMR